MPQVRALIATVLQMDPAALSEDDGADTLGAWTSLKTMMLASTLEITYDITLDNSDIERLTSVRAVREVIARHGV